MQIYVKDLLARLVEKDSFELRVFYQTSCQRLYTGNAGGAVPPAIMAEKIKSWTTFSLSDPLEGNKPFYVLQIESFHKMD